MLEKLTQFWRNIQGELFPFVEKVLDEPLTNKLKQVIRTLELIQIENFIHTPIYRQGQSPKYRKQIARSFIAKAVYNMGTTRELIDRLQTTPALRRICGWGRVSEIPHESSFSRAFAEFAKNSITNIVQEYVIKENYKDEIIGHNSRDSTAIEAREKPVKKNKDKSRSVSEVVLRKVKSQKKSQHVSKGSRV